MDHPSRYALVEVVNIHDPALTRRSTGCCSRTADVRQALVQAFARA
jgi:hypothetical protein